MNGSAYDKRQTANILLIASLDGVTGYDVNANAFLWVVLQENLKLFANTFTCFAYNSNNSNIPLHFTAL